MKNADMPAMSILNSNGAPVLYSNAGMDNKGVMFGLTKREEMAMHMMASLTSIYWEEYKSGAELIKCQSETTVEMVDALLAELERTK